MRSKLETQCWICPKCHDDHGTTAACTPIDERPFIPHPEDKSFIAEELQKLLDRSVAEMERRFAGILPTYSDDEDALRDALRALDEEGKQG